MRKIEIRIIKPQSGLAKGKVKTVDRRVAVDMVERGSAEFVNDEDKEEVESRKAENAKKSNEAIHLNAEKAKARTAPDDKRAKKLKKEQDAAKDKQLKMMLGKRKSLLNPFADFVDLKSEEYKLKLETTKEEFQMMLSNAKQAKSDHEASIVEKHRLFDERTEQLSVYSEVIDVTRLTIDSTEDEFNTLMAEGVEKLPEEVEDKDDSSNVDKATEEPKKVTETIKNKSGAPKGSKGLKGSKK